MVKKENISSFLIAKMYEINFYQKLLARVCMFNEEVWTILFNMKKYPKLSLLYCQLNKI